jgi:hypothetical protein|tara:strand:- start:100 stop:285 length:186 start_codon:yes stop_codon:yes gene_type:complete
MSYDVKLNVDDYQNIIRWFELAFAKTNNQTGKDKNTFTKLSAMAMSFTEDLKEDEEMKGDS